VEVPYSPVVAKPVPIKNLEEANQCEFHRMKIQKLSQELNDMIEQNLRIKEQNMKLRLLNQNLSNKVEEKNLAIKQHIAQLKFDEEIRATMGSTVEFNNQGGSSSSPKKPSVSFKNGSPSKLGGKRSSGDTSAPSKNDVILHEAVKLA